MFYTEILINDIHFAKTLIDSDYSNYALISNKFAKRIRVETLLIKPRPVEGILDGMDGKIREIAKIDLDIEGYRMRRVFAYVLPRQTEDLILERP